MTIKVTATCAWCLVTVETDIKKPIPDKWIEHEVRSPDLSVPSVSENFCSADHRDHYLHYSPEAILAAETDYAAKFLSAMNILRADEKKEPRLNPKAPVKAKDA